MLFDLHTHSKYSIDALSKPETMINICKKKGIGISITDHNNMDVYFKGKVKQIAKEKKVFLIPGEEIKVLANQPVNKKKSSVKNSKDILSNAKNSLVSDKCVGEVIAYFLNKEIKPNTFENILDEIKQQGALLSCPHPFDWPRKNFKEFSNEWRKFDSMEVYNARAYYSGLNKKSQKFHDVIFKEKRISALGVSDAHTPEEIGNGLTEINAVNEEEFRKAIKKGQTKIIKNNKAGFSQHLQTQFARKNIISER
ncbi:MAG: PHP-associated domain-containing protein [Candidatus ainarchaeum sp.]|nr:PHP-associated domain-containing protein [Candidatus ainarchaeum sp.]